MPQFIPRLAILLRPLTGAASSQRSLLVLALCALLSACGGGGGGSRNNVATAPPVANPAPGPTPAGVVATNAYKSQASFANNLQRCTYLGTNTETCTLSELPFLGQRVNAPTIEDVMDRTLVSHAWMGDNFRSLLQLLPADLLELFKSVTAVVIASDVRPAFYDPNTGAIYLDPDFLWATDAERNTVSTAPDFRSNFGDALQVSLPWRYVKNNENFSIRLNPDGSRDFSEVVVILGFLLYHELAHATDFMHPSRMASLDTNRTAASYLTSGQGYLSNTFRVNYPLSSQLMDELAGVSFRGDTATSAQEALTPADITNEFPEDGAIQYYAYTTSFEDFATTFETAMMSFHFGYEKDVAITDNPPNTNDAVVAWGQRGRLGAQQLNQRSLAAVQAVALSNQTNVEAHINGLPLPTQMRVGDTWSANLALGPPAVQPQFAPPTKNAGSSAAENGEAGELDYFFDRVWIK